MTSRASDSNRVALASPGATLAPLDSEARADYRQDRIGYLPGLSELGPVPRTAS